MIAARDRIEVWGGPECSIVMAGGVWRDEISETGHADRLDDLDRIKTLGLDALRYPVLWESIAPDEPGVCDWRWHDARLEKLRDLGLTPIAGLLHHGAGPRYTDLLDPAFPRLFADHARRVAERYPWVTRYTPVNEPLTTARFCGLYGHWRPYGRSDRAFLRALVNQCAATKLAMQAIRRQVPQAQLVQTEDLGKTFATTLLRYQAAHENARRWLSLDLLCGRIDRTHPWRAILLGNGIGEAELADFVDDPCPPDIIGINHYLTSERFLDERLQRYPQHLHGGNGRHRYADAEAVRHPLPEGATGPLARLREAWARYRLPLAVTEAHHGCTRDEQLRWLAEMWSAAQTLKREGTDIRAVTLWSLFGAYDWNSLLTRRAGYYEAGAFDARSTPPRPTALARAAAALAKTGRFDHPALDAPGWWRRDGRFYHAEPAPPCAARRHARPLVIAGATGTLGRALSRICAQRGLAHHLLTRADMDIADPQAIEATLRRLRPWAVINAAGYVRVAEAQREAERCMRENARGPERLARACAAAGVRLVTFSSDLVFDGRLGRAYREADAPSPLCVYGRSKAEAERRVLAACPEALIVRTSAFFGPWDPYNFARTVLAELAAGRTVAASRNERVSPTYVPDLVHAALDLLIDAESGLWHLANDGASSWFDFALRLADQARLPQRLVRAAAVEPRDTSLASARGALMPSLDNSIERFFSDRRDAA